MKRFTYRSCNIPNNRDLLPCRPTPISEILPSVKDSNTHAGAKIISDTQITLGGTLQDLGGAATKI